MAEISPQQVKQTDFEKDESMSDLSSAPMVMPARDKEFENTHNQNTMPTL
jgi:hypothetical protein